MNYVGKNEIICFFFYILILIKFIYIIIYFIFLYYTLAWLIVFLINGQIYVHEICNYPDIDNTFILWSDEDFACVKNIWIENISNDMCLIFITKMSFLLIILYSLTQKKLLLTKKEIIPMTTFVAGNLT